MIKQLIPMAVLVAVLNTPAEAASLKEMATAAKADAAKAVNALVVRPAMAAKAFVVSTFHTATATTASVGKATLQAADQVVDGADKAVNSAVGK